VIGDFIIFRTIYLPSDLTWRLEGTTFFGSKCDTGYFGLETSGAITEKKGGASIQYSNVRRTLSWAVIAMKRTFQAFIFSILFKCNSPPFETWRLSMHLTIISALVFGAQYKEVHNLVSRNHAGGKWLDDGQGFSQQVV
jgi:hypothetical protein